MQRLDHFVEPDHDLTRETLDDLAVTGGSQPTRVAMEKHDAEDRFDLLQGLGHGRLAEAQIGRGCADRAMFDQSQDHIQLLHTQLIAVRQAWKVLDHPHFRQESAPIVGCRGGLPPASIGVIAHEFRRLHSRPRGLSHVERVKDP